MEDIRSEANGEIAAAEAGIRDRTLVQLTRTLLDTVGDKEGLIRDLFHWVPATLYDNAICTGFATVVPVPDNWDRAVNAWGAGGLASRSLEGKVSSLMVPPGYELILYEGDWQSASYTVTGRMRDDNMGIFCHVLPDEWNNRATQLRYRPLQ